MELVKNKVDNHANVLAQKFSQSVEQTLKVPSRKSISDMERTDWLSETSKKVSSS